MSFIRATGKRGAEMGNQNEILDEVDNLKNQIHELLLIEASGLPDRQLVWAIDTIRESIERLKESILDERRAAVWLEVELNKEDNSYEEIRH
jgi:hypothetical protein